MTKGEETKHGGKIKEGVTFENPVSEGSGDVTRDVTRSSAGAAVSPTSTTADSTLFSQSPFEQNNRVHLASNLHPPRFRSILSCKHLVCLSWVVTVLVTPRYQNPGATRMTSAGPRRHWGQTRGIGSFVVSQRAPF
eukprot:sb/3474597/